MKTKFNQLVYLSLGSLLQIGLLMSCTNDSQELNDVSASDEEIVIPVSNNLTAVSCGSVQNTWSGFGGQGGDHNVGVSAQIDDRSCSYDYTQSTYGSIYDWGVYRLLSSDDVGSLQTRIERQTRNVNKVKNGNKIKFSGWCRILQVGTTTNTPTSTYSGDQNGTYIFQAKGKDDQSGTKSPALCLFIAKAARDSKNGNKVIPISSTDSRAKYFDIYREQVGGRNGSGTLNRSLVYITTVEYNKDFFVSSVTGFTGSGSSLRHYVNTTINGVTSNWNVPNPEKSLETYFRMGAYRCWGGNAVILWRKGTTASDYVNN